YLTLFVLLYSFQSSRAHRYLHSFPTRRSSDLMRTRWPPEPTTSASSPSIDAIVPRTPTSGASTGSPGASGASTGSGRSSSRSARSEEHTSELQSRVDLVCRLLLEKKKNK